jgi:flagellar hook-associated protein 1 FlgK
MADLFSLLSTSASSLAAQSGATATAGNNIANANTPGYTRQIANIEAMDTAGSSAGVFIGRGAQLTSVTQARDQFVERQLPQAFSQNGSSQAQSKALASVNALDPQASGSLQSMMGAFYTSLRSLSQNPGDVGLRQSAINAAQQLAQSFNVTAKNIEGTRTAVDSDIQATVEKVNADAQGVAALNVQIISNTINGQRPNDLLDKRQKLIDELSTLTGATPYESANGNISLALPGGTTLVNDDHAATLSVVPDPTNGGHDSLRILRPDGSGPYALASSSLSGQLGGDLTVRDGTLKSTLDAVDSLAFDFATAMNNLATAGVALDGTNGHALFTLTATASGAASALQVSSALAANPSLFPAGQTAGSPGDNANLLAMIATEQQTLTTSGATPSATLQRLTASFGSQTAQAKAFADQDGALVSHLGTLRDSASGVSIDEEMINLTKSQRAYQAIAKVITTADGMLQTLLAIKPV